MAARPVDKIFLSVTIALLVAGFFIFLSSAFGVAAKNVGKFDSIVIRQVAVGFVGGALAMYAASRIDYHFYRRHALTILLSSLALTLLVFVPYIGFNHGGAERWIDLRIITIQPAEFLKFGLIVYVAAWLNAFQRRIHSPAFGIIPLMVVIGIAGAILIAQPDTGTLVIVAAACITMYFTATGKWSHLAILLLVSIVALIGVAFLKPYVMDRITTLLHPGDFQGTGYQVKQSLIAVGSGGLFGRGYGQGVQKYTYLPEPSGDSIFAVAAEEFGFVGSSLLVVLYLLFAMRGLMIASRSSDKFGGLLALGIVILIMSQTFMNIGSMLALIPLNGDPLVFVSQGGTALVSAMFLSGIVLNISRKTQS